MVIIIAVAVAATAVAVQQSLHPSAGSAGTLLVPKKTTDLIPAGEFDAIVVDAKSPSEIEGTITIIQALTIYTMSQSEFSSYVKTSVLSAYTWTSGPLQNLTYYTLSVPVPAGVSYLVLQDPTPVQTLVGYDTSLTLDPS